MKRKLDRVLRIRTLLEELSQLNLDVKVAEMRHLENAAEQQRSLALAARADALRLLLAGAGAPSEDWLTGIADADLLEWKRAKLIAAATLRAPAVEAARQALLIRRVERRQAATLAAAAAEAEEKKQIRREQNRIDDWFQNRRMRGKTSG